MKIISISECDLRARESLAAREAGVPFHIPSPMERAFTILLLAFKEINQAGLEGKEITDLKIVQVTDRSVPPPDGGRIEIHGTVKWRLKGSGGA